MPNRWTNAEPNPGSAFHELVVLPTLAPHLARPYETKGQPGASAAPQPTSDAAGGEASTSEAAAGPAEVIPPVVQDRLFFVHVVLLWSVPVQSGRTVKKQNKDESKSLPQDVAVLKMSRADIITNALSAHGYEDRYVAGPVSGPAFRIHWTGSPGGKTNAPTVHTDAEWDGLRRQLEQSRASVNTVNVIFNLDAMDGYRTRKRALSPDHNEAHTELTRGTRVPTVDAYSPEDRKQAEKMNQIKECWDCAVHGACYIDAGSKHIPLNRFRLKQWASALLANDGSALDPPPDKLIIEWEGTVSTPHAVATPKPRGRSGPNPAAASSSTVPFTSSPAVDPNILLTTLTTMAMQSFQQSLAQSPARPTSQLPEPPVTPSSKSVMGPKPSNNCPSSPPPLIEDELTKCLQAFGHEKKISNGAIALALSGLEDASYSPDTLDGPSVARLQELTGLPEGQVYQLRHFAATWCGKMDAKRARRI